MRLAWRVGHNQSFLMQLPQKRLDLRERQPPRGELSFELFANAR